MNKLRKAITIGVMVMTVMSMVGFQANAAAPQAGDLIKMDGLSTVYFLGNDGKRYVYPHSSVFFTWHNDFSGVVTVSPSELASYPLGANVVMRAGTKLVKITTDPSVYTVEPNGVLRKIQSEADAIALFGSTWSKRVVDVADSFFTNYTVGTPLASGQVPAGSLVKNASSASIYYFNGTNYRTIASESAFNANRFSFANVITVTNAITAGGNAITGAEFGYDAQGGSQGTVVTGSGLTASLSGITAASASVIGSQALVPFTSFNLTAANDGAVIVKTIKLKRTGISSDGSMGDMYLYEGNVRLTDAASLSNGFVTFSASNLMTIPAGQTKTLTIKGDIAAGAFSGNVGFAINAASDVVTTAAVLSGSFPISGNLMSIVAKPADLSVVTLTAGTSATSPIKAGNSNAIVWSATTLVANKAVDFKYLALKQVGSISADDLANLSLYVDGTKVASSALTTNNDLIFDLATPSRLTTGNHTIELKADIIKGSNRTFAFQMQTLANAVFTDTNYNVNVSPSAVINGISYLISSGSVTTSVDTSFNTTEVVKTATNVTLGKFTMKAFGEDVKVNQLGTHITFTGTATTSEGLNDLAIYVDGNQVGSSKSYVFGAPDSTFGTTNLFTIPAGKQVVVEIKGSMNLTTATTTLITAVKADLNVLVSQFQGVTSYTTFGTAATVGGKNLSVVTGNLTVAKNSSVQNTNVSKNTAKVKIGSYILSAGSAEGVTISNLRVGVNASSTVLDNMSNLYISENTTPVQPQSINDFNTSLSIAKSQSKVVDVYADLGDIANTFSASTTLQVTYRTDVTLSNGTSVVVDGQTMTLTTGSMTDPTIVASDPASYFVIGGTTATAAKYKFIATNGNSYINEISLTASTTFEGISQVIIDGVSAPVIAGKVVVAGLNHEILAGNQGGIIEVKAVYNTVTSNGAGGVATGNDINLTITGYKYTVNGTQQAPVTGKTIASGMMRLVSTYPTVADVSSYTSKTLISGGKSEVMRFTVTGTGVNGVNIKSIGLKANYDYNATSTGAQIYIQDASNLGTDLATTANTYGVSGANSILTLTNALEIASGATKTYVVLVNNTGSTVVGNYFRVDMVNANWAWNDGTTAIGTFPINGTYVKEFTGTTFQK